MSCLLYPLNFFFCKRKKPAETSRFLPMPAGSINFIIQFTIAGRSQGSTSRSHFSAFPTWKHLLLLIPLSLLLNKPLIIPSNNLLIILLLLFRTKSTFYSEQCSILFRTMLIFTENRRTGDFLQIPCFICQYGFLLGLLCP